MENDLPTEKMEFRVSRVADRQLTHHVYFLEDPLSWRVNVAESAYEEGYFGPDKGDRKHKVVSS